METPLNFQFEFDNISDTSHDLFEDSKVLELQELQEANLYKEIIQRGKKAYHCTFPDCGKVFQFKSAIARHAVIHQKDRPYCCNFKGCNKSFKRSDALENHVKIHVGMQPFSCDLPGCDKTFSTKASLRNHQKRHARKHPSKDDGFDRLRVITPTIAQNQESYMKGCSEMKFVKEEPVKITVGQSIVLAEPEVQKGDIETKRELLNNIQWEIKSQGDGNEDYNENAREKFEALFKYILNENKILRERLREQEKLVSENTQKYGFESEPAGNQIQILESQDGSSFFDNNEMKFLDFLKEQENNIF